MSYFQRIGPSLVVTAFFALPFGALALTLSGAVHVIATIGLSITLWLGFIYVVNEARFFFPKPIRTAIRWLHAMSFELIIVILAQIVFRPLLHFFGNPGPTGNPNGTPILLIHGYLCDWTGWIYVRWKLKRAGYGPIYALDLKNALGSISDHAQDINEMAGRIKQETGRSDLILIGHSMGGLVASIYASQQAPSGTVQAVITIGSPLSGTQMAHIGFLGKSPKEMLPDSSVIQKVQESLEKHPEILLFQAMSQADELIFPQTSAVADNHFDRHYIVDDIGHMTLLFSSRIANRICLWIKNITSSKNLKSG